MHKITVFLARTPIASVYRSLFDIGIDTDADKGSTFGQGGLLKNGECSPMQFCMEIPKLCSKSAKRFCGTRKSVPKIDTGFALSHLRRCQQPLPIGGVAQWQASSFLGTTLGVRFPCGHAAFAHFALLFRVFASFVLLFRIYKFTICNNFWNNSK